MCIHSVSVKNTITHHMVHVHTHTTRDTHAHTHVHTNIVSEAGSSRDVREVVADTGGASGRTSSGMGLLSSAPFLVKVP